MQDKQEIFSRETIMAITKNLKKPYIIGETGLSDTTVWKAQNGHAIEHNSVLVLSKFCNEHFNRELEILGKKLK